MATALLQAYYDLLAAHDWSYMMSDDAGVYNRGSSAAAKLQAHAKASPEHQALYDAYYNYFWKKGPKPERPNA